MQPQPTTITHEHYHFQNMNESMVYFLKETTHATLITKWNVCYMFIWDIIRVTDQSNLIRGQGIYVLILPVCITVDISMLKSRTPIRRTLP